MLPRFSLPEGMEKETRRRLTTKQVKPQMIAGGCLSDDVIARRHHELGDALYLVLGDGGVRVGTAPTDKA